MTCISLRKLAAGSVGEASRFAGFPKSKAGRFAYSPVSRFLMAAYYCSSGGVKFQKVEYRK
jgi:hypothetical protein